ncbi:methylenetetrahydrofolate reductase [Microbacterium sp. NPDC058062]|uniref:methylenetetrahydrofolate reductase n=1 Tax=Microbacterium sp. NPDC058062 TaxID=3346320 RepID=UPI0036DCE76B
MTRSPSRQGLSEAPFGSGHHRGDPAPEVDPESVSHLASVAGGRRFLQFTQRKSSLMADPSATAEAVRSLIDAFSLEMTGKDVPGLLEAKDTIPPRTKVNITFLGNEDLDMRIAAAKAVRELGFVAVPHISARRLASRAQLEQFLSRLRDVGATEHVFVVGGDPATPEGPYEDSYDVIRTGLLPDYGVKEVSIAGYPEGHPNIPNEVLWRALEEKSSSLAQQGLNATILTQFAFDTDPVLGWIEDVRTRGIRSTIRIGTPGPAGIKRLIGFARRFGIGANAMIVQKYGFSLTNLLGTAGPDRFVTDLALLLNDSSAGVSYGSINLHFYTFGGLRATSVWAREFLAVES